MQFEKDLLALPLGLPTAASLDLGRLQNDEAKRLHPILPAIWWINHILKSIYLFQVEVNTLE